MPQTPRSRRAPDVGGSLDAAVAAAGAPPEPQEPPVTQPSFVLPTEARPASGDLKDKIAFIYGPPKIGKSTLANEFGRVLFFELEPGLSEMAVLTTEGITDWSTFCEWVKLAVADGGRSYDAFCIDTCDMLAERCSEHTNARLGVAHESDLDFGKGWSVAKKELIRWVNKLAAVPDTGLIFISHSQDVEIKTRSEKYDRTVPTLSKGARSVFLDMADLVLLVEVDDEGEDERHVIKARPSRYHEAGTRGRVLPETIDWPLGGGFAALNAAWEEAKR